MSSPAKWIVLSSALFVIGCANGPCRQTRHPELTGQTGSGAAVMPQAPVAPPGGKGATVSESNSKASGAEGTVFVAKPDGSLQCGMGKGASLEEMEKQLAGIKVLSRQKRPDGMMHIQVCGSPTGMVNVYEIPASSLKDAIVKGFKKFEPPS